MLIEEVGKLGQEGSTGGWEGLAPNAIERLAGSLYGNIDIC